MFTKWLGVTRSSLDNVDISFGGYFINNIESYLSRELAINTAKLNSLDEEINNLLPVRVESNVISAIGYKITTSANGKRIGDICLIKDPAQNLYIKSEVISIDGNYATLTPFGTINNLSSEAVVTKINSEFSIIVGDFLIGNYFDGFGNIINQNIGINDSNNIRLIKKINQVAPDPFTRPIIDKQLITGISAIDLFTTIGIGQRIAIFAAPGIGKTTLIGMIVRNVQAEIVVVCLVGERGREVREFLDLEIDAETRKRTVLIIATSDKSSAEQAKAPFIAQTIAEYFRDQGKNVVLFIDSITRYARAQREISLSSGEDIVRGGYPSSVFLSFPKLIERAGNTPQGSITAFYTVLMESEISSIDHIAEEVKSIVDGHIYLSRKLAAISHFPAIDVLSSLSRVADRINSTNHSNAARKARMLLSKYEELELLIRVGEYKQGNDKVADEAINKNDAINKILKQDTHEIIDFKDALNRFCQLLGS